MSRRFAVLAAIALAGVALTVGAAAVAAPRKALCIVRSVRHGEAAEEPVRRFLASRRIGYPVALDAGPSPAWRAFQVRAVPAAFLLDREGRIVAQWTGVPADTAELELRLREPLAAD
jgi:hypothetical protein